MFCIADETTIGTGRRNGIFHDGMLLEIWSPRKARRGQAGRRAKLTMWAEDVTGRKAALGRSLAG
ncbi:hypothetical protein ACFVZ8_07765 [Streptomyces sp. NPDC059558]|uniref:hypothetical protein n=1 Tax=unclassified Streptomyces TaxID=2593676 RepID=UPI0036C17A13